jgi:hypothetical protein
MSTTKAPVSEPQRCRDCGQPLSEEHARAVAQRAATRKDFRPGKSDVPAQRPSKEITS